MRRILAIFICICMLTIPVKAAGSEKLVSLTFDDGPSGKFTQRLLEGLEARGAKATFFLCGYRMAQYPQLTEQILADGHEIGSSIELLPEDCALSFLRPPGGIYGECVRSAAEEQGLSILHWSVDPKDWAINNAQAVFYNLIENFYLLW